MRLALTADINALLTHCEVHLQPDGSPTPDTQLQRWPRFAPPPKCLRVVFKNNRRDSLHCLEGFLGGCLQQELAVRLLQEVQVLHLKVRAAGCKHRATSLALPWLYPFVFVLAAMVLGV